MLATQTDPKVMNAAAAVAVTAAVVAVRAVQAPETTPLDLSKTWPSPVMSAWMRMTHR
ncbi:MAG: hypothetical protein RIS44_2246 [Pseudomonadota bacterium]|jgi:hypothetical protein